MTNSTWAPLPSVLSPSNSAPIRLIWNDKLRDHGRQAAAGADLRRREIHLHPSLRHQPSERSRILTHELFHFVWIRLGNPRRADWKQLLEGELRRGARGELGWSSQWRKSDLPENFSHYACEAFCDTAAWLYSSCREHEEYALAPRWRARRRAWFLANLKAPVRF
jgi:predicted SprT family Zn-dependent metalloprotease